MYKEDEEKPYKKDLLSVLVNVYELVAFIELSDESLRVYTRQVIWKKREPYYAESYEKSIERFIQMYVPAGNREDTLRRFRIKNFKAKLKNKDRYDFVYPCSMDGELRYKQVTILWGDKKYASICMVRTDVTDSLLAEWDSRKQLEGALAIAKEANEAKSEFLASMSHDIRTPMNAIIGMAELAMTNREDPEQVAQSLATIKRAAKRLLKMFNNILDMGRMENGRMVSRRQRFSHAEEMNRMAAHFGELARRKGIQFSHTLEVVHDECIGDALRIQQILTNLMENSVKFTPEGGMISLEEKELCPSNGQIGIYQYKITDNGMGIAESDMKQMFEPVYRTDITKNQETGGTGLELSIARNLIDYMGGTVRVESRIKEGTCFTVQLPVRLAETEKNDVSDADEEPAREEKPAEEKPIQEKTEKRDLKGMRILLVEDHPVNQLITTKMLENMNAVVTVAENGYIGKEMFINSKPGQFDVICMDIQMPVMDGYESATAIRKSSHAQAKCIPIVAVTANAFLSDVSRCLECGMNVHIAKPIEAANLYQVLKNFAR